MVLETGKIIQKKRIEAGFTQKILAEALNVTDKAVSKWERGLSFPDITLIPKLSRLLDVDVDVLISHTGEIRKWSGLIDVSSVDFSEKLFDKPLVYYFLSHYLLLGLDEIFVLTTPENKKYLQREEFGRLGFHFQFEEPKGRSLMIMNEPWFVFGSDLTEQFQGSMLSGADIKLLPVGQEPVFFFANDSGTYFRDKAAFMKSAARRSLGRGMVCIRLSSEESILDASNFVRIYQKHSSLLIGSLEEIARVHSQN